MHIKVERFLTLTAMLASSHVGLVGCGDDGTAAEPSSGDAGSTSASTTDTSASNTDEGSSHADGGSGDDAGSLNASLDTPDGGGLVSDAAVMDGGDADVTTSPDAAFEPGSDAGGETTWPDAGHETWPDAGGDGCLGGDFADESDLGACYSSFASCETYSAAWIACDTLNTDYRAGIVEVFWDCYHDANVEDPCSEEADYVASGCYSFAMENAPLCDEPIEDCVGVVGQCAALTIDACESALAPYNSGHRAASLQCTAAQLANQAGPDYEGCDNDFFDCAFSPSVE